MGPEANEPEANEPVPDPNDLIVGTIEPPAWLGEIPALLRGIPTLAWLFVGLAVFDAAFRVWTRSNEGGLSLDPANLGGLVFAVVGGATIVLLPAAMIIGRRDRGRAESWLLQGGVALALAELVGLVGDDVLAAVLGRPQIIDNAGPFGISTYVFQLLAVQVPVVLLRMFGLAKIGLGLGAIAAPARPLGRVVFAVIAVGLAVPLVGEVVTLQTIIGTAVSADLVAYDLVILVGTPIVIALWAWVATIAARRDGPPWRWILGGALAIELAYAIQTGGNLVALQQAFTDGALTILTWSSLLASAVRAAGGVALVVGFGRGFEPQDELEYEDDEGFDEEFDDRTGEQAIGGATDPVPSARVADA